jgi:hypothetical protein
VLAASREVLAGKLTSAQYLERSGARERVGLGNGRMSSRSPADSAS